MKILCLGDLHIRATNPRYRTDSYFETMLGKLKWIFDLAKEQGCTCILQPGDFFDSPDQSNMVEISLINLLTEKAIQIYTILGQHDLRHRQSLNVALVKFDVLDKVRIIDSNGVDLGDNVHLYGASWEEDVPEVKDKKATNLLIIHRMVTTDGPLWYNHENYTTAKELLRKYDDFDLIVSGDNHQSFAWSQGDGRNDKNTRHLLNCGSLMRTTIAQRGHEPCVHLVDTETNEVIQHKIPILPIEDVMNLELADERKERNEALEAFMTGLSSEYKVELSFEDNLTNLMKANNINREIQGIAYSMIGKYYDINK